MYFHAMKSPNLPPDENLGSSFKPIPKAGARGRHLYPAVVRMQVDIFRSSAVAGSLFSHSKCPVPEVV